MKRKHSSRHHTYFSSVGQSHGVVGATGHLCDNLIQQVCRHQHRGHLLIGCSISQLAVTIMTPGKNRSIWATKRLLVTTQPSFTHTLRDGLRKKKVFHSHPQWPAGHGVHCRSSGWPPSARWRSLTFWARWCSGSPLFPDSYCSWVRTQTPDCGGGKWGGGEEVEHSAGISDKQGQVGTLPVRPVGNRSHSRHTNINTSGRHWSELHTLLSCY